ncbi:hypothetical protein CDL12_12112 [Handroanthus impetiginosus]|uniref:Uncharacterized protein n=1 Tax=Handroanthus impetiginosus TaxID=429701 RepID=A0A2G9HCK8_9LAMI|nr:hypothetical protein CDL12_12112 [Handroanthus impetiginosus]
MGSLMAGWDSPVPDPNAAKFRRNKSLTKEEIEAYWKSKKQREEEHLRDISLLSPRTQKIIFEETAERSKQGEGTVPLPAAEKELLDLERETSLDKNGWWISSNWAFLNEPPVIAQEGTGEKYAAQFHVAKMAGSAAPHGPTGISA